MHSERAARGGGREGVRRGNMQTMAVTWTVAAAGVVRTTMTIAAATEPGATYMSAAGAGPATRSSSP
jgi:hypothetical protein